MLRPRLKSRETVKRRSLLQRMMVVHGVLLFLTLTVVARLMELQIVRGAEFRQKAELQHFGNVRLPARRGEIFALSSKTGERNILATNTTLNLLYVDPQVVKGHAAELADQLADLLLTPQVHQTCVRGDRACPPELISLLYSVAFDPLEQQKLLGTGALLEPMAEDQALPPELLNLPEYPEAKRLFARSIEQRIGSERVRFAPLKYGATKVQLRQVMALNLPGITVVPDKALIYANPEEVPQGRIQTFARQLARALEADAEAVQGLLKSRPLRYVPIMRRLPPVVSLKVKQLQLQSFREAQAAWEAQAKAGKETEFTYPMRAVALIPEHWRFYPDGTTAAHVVGFLNTNEEAQYGIERAFQPQLKGQAGIISSVRDLAGGSILTSSQTIVKPKDGDSIVLTIDRTIQKEVETILAAAVERYQADAAQVIVTDPFTGRILAMVNAPLFNSNDYADVYQKEPMIIHPGEEERIEVELYDPDTNVRLLRASYHQVFTPEGRAQLSQKTRSIITDLEKLYDLKTVTRYYYLIGPYYRREIFPTPDPRMWLKFRNNLGVGAYLNRAVQAIYEPGSVMKPITMAIAIDQGEVTPMEPYDDLGPVKVDEYEIKNALGKHYGRVTMSQCLEYSINTCMTSVSFKLGPKLFQRMLERFGFGRITGIELEDELTGELKPWYKKGDWPDSLLATMSYGQGISVTPLQMASAFAVLANGGKLIKPTIVDRVIHPDGTEEVTEPKVLDQVITPETADTVTSMLISSVDRGYALKGGVRGYYIAGKTGTSQIAGPGGKYISGTGSTITSFIGYAPARKPKFLVYVKFDRPRRDFFGSSTAVPVFHDIAAFLFKYYGLPPER